MKYTELKNSIAEGPRPVYLLEGEDAYFRFNGEKMIRDAFLQFPELNFASFEGETLKDRAIGGLVAAVKSYPFMAERRIVKVSEFYPTEGEYNTYLKGLFQNFPSTAILIIVNRGDKKSYDLKRKKEVTYVDCGKSDPEAVTKWVYITLKRAGIYCPASVAANIGAYCLWDMARVSREVQKIADYKTGGELTQAEADELVYKDADYRIYEMTGAVARRDYGSYCRISADLKSKGFDETGILNGLFSYFRNLLSAAVSPLTDRQYAEENGLKEYSVKKNREQARAIGEKNLQRLINSVYGAISDIKSGLVTPQAALQRCEAGIFFGLE